MCQDKGKTPFDLKFCEGERHRFQIESQALKRKSELNDSLFSLFLVVHVTVRDQVRYLPPSIRYSNLFTCFIYQTSVVYYSNETTSSRIPSHSRVRKISGWETPRFWYLR